MLFRSGAGTSPVFKYLFLIDSRFFYRLRMISISIPIVLLTARDDKQSQLSGYKNGADAYLTKPFEIEMLMEIIRNRLKNRESIKKRYLNTGLVR